MAQFDSFRAKMIRQGKLKLSGGDIRQAIVDADMVDCMVAMPGQLFYTTQIPVCLWFVTRSKKADNKRGYRDRTGQTYVFA